jgi:hypothetical protein
MENTLEHEIELYPLEAFNMPGQIDLRTQSYFQK